MLFKNDQRVQIFFKDVDVIKIHNDKHVFKHHTILLYCMIFEIQILQCIMQWK